MAQDLVATRQAFGDNKTGIQFTLFQTREDLDFADDLVLLIQKITCVQQKIDALQQQIVRVGLKVNASKIKEMRFQSPTTTGDNICGEEERLWSTLVTAFKYLGSPVTTTCGTEEDVEASCRKA